MPIFHETAIRAAAGDGSDLSWLRPEHLADWPGLAKVLERFTAEQSCDAIYADWLLQLNSPARQALLQVRNLLIGQGAIAANYLAELAQNADDASDGQRAEVRIRLEGDWLIVGNNGRKVTSMNLLGLCRFFVHAAGKVVELNDETIGRFGIGFKSCYRIASEVFVLTWGRGGPFGFRLPICREGDKVSEPDRQRLERLLGRLRQAGVTHLDHELRETRCLGYCTPEFLDALPPDLARATEAFRQSERGTVFCFRLRPDPDRRQEVGSRITGQEKELYELCPLFLPNLRLVQLAQHELRMSVGQRDTAHDCPGLVEADKVTLTIRDLANANSPASNSRFWRLRGVTDGDLWQIALHADSSFRLRVEREEDERGTTIKDGSAYAFFPLNGVNWPFRIHLHLKLPTDLRRSEWNPDDAPQVEEQMRRAIHGLAVWLDRHADKWHPSWRLESLVARVPNQAERWARLAWESLLKETENLPLLRTIFGKRVRRSEARYLKVLENQAASQAWAQLGQTQELDINFPAFVGEDASCFEIPAAIPDEVASAFVMILENGDVPGQGRRAALLAYLSCGQHSSASLERAFGEAVAERHDGALVRLGELMGEPSGAELAPEWHEVFARLVDWSQTAVWQNAHVFGERLPDQFRKLAKPVFNPSWPEVATRLGIVEEWRAHGTEFWANARRPCPPENRRSVLACLHVPSGDGGWLPLHKVWADDDGPVDCFSGLLAAWPLNYRDAERQRITGLLKQWGLFDEWEMTTTKMLADRLPGELTRRLAEQSDGNAFAVVFDRAFEDARRILDTGWKAIVDEAEKTAVRRFLVARQQEDQLRGKTLLSAEIGRAVRAALRLLPDLEDAPPWLTEAAWKRIRRLGLLDDCKFEFLASEGFKLKQGDYARQLLENFYRWTTGSPSQEQLAGLNELAASVSVAQRKNWVVGLSPQKRRPLRELLLGTPTSGTTPSARLLSRLLALAEWRVEPLPHALAGVPAVAEACVQTSSLEMEQPSLGVLMPIDVEQLAPDLRGDQDIKAMCEAAETRLLGCPREINLRWRYDGDTVATLSNADFVLLGNRLVVHRYGAPADEEQCQRILAEFETHATPPDEYQTDKHSLSRFECYQRHRETIRNTLLKELVTKVGYERHHVLRELLQNAESAYASKQGTVEEAWFEFAVTSAAAAGRRKVTAGHAGRAFNERDNEGKERRDVERIWRLAAENERTPDEIGRFNRGFKVVFTVAADGVVRIRSGAYEFEVLDLLLLRPAEPKPKPGPPSQTTEFSFETTLADGLAMLRLARTPGPTEHLPVVNASSLVFLRHLQRVCVKFESRTWTWRISRRADRDDWRRVEIQSPDEPKPEIFLVFKGRDSQTPATASGRRFAAAVRVSENGLPQPLESGWRTFRLTFETEHPFPLDFLVNGDFEADQGRIAPRDIARSGLVELAYKAVFDRAAQELRDSPTREVWLAWAKILHVKDAAKQLEVTLRDDGKRFRHLAQEIAGFFAANIPFNGRLLPADQLKFPTRVFRRIGERFGNRWGINRNNWVDEDIAAELPEGDRPKARFDHWAAQQMRAVDSPLQADHLRLMIADLQATNDLRRGLLREELDELETARRILEEKLHSVPPPSSPARKPLLEIQEKSAQELWEWWNGVGRPLRGYTLDGANWDLLYPGDSTGEVGRKQRLQNALSQPSTASGRRVWYRLLGLACLMSAGWGRTIMLRDFWQKTLEEAQFWEHTAGKDFANETRELFSRLVGRQHPNVGAAGEDAEYWRHVFYDVRKVHELVFGEYRFAETVWQLASDPRRAGELPQFLRSGRLAGQAPLAGVLGQSAGAPIFFVVRELCRLGIVPREALANLRPLAFFACTPVRRAAVRIGWIDAALAARTDFESLSEVSRQLHERISKDRSVDDTTRQKLLDLYDIPLLHLGLTE